MFLFSSQPAASHPCCDRVPTGRETEDKIIDLRRAFSSENTDAGAASPGKSESLRHPASLTRLPAIRGNSRSPSGFHTSQAGIRKREKDFCKIRGKTGAGPSSPSSHQSATTELCPRTAPSPLNHQHLHRKTRATGVPGPLPYVTLRFPLIPGISLTIIIKKIRQDSD